MGVAVGWFVEWRYVVFATDCKIAAGAKMPAMRNECPSDSSDEGLFPGCGGGCVVWSQHIFEPVCS